MDELYYTLQMYNYKQTVKKKKKKKERDRQNNNLWC